MNYKQGRKHSRNMTVQQYLDAHKEKMSQFPNYLIFLALLEEAIEDIKSYGELQEFNTIGHTERKSNLRNLIVRMACDISTKAYAFAMSMNDELLINEVRYNKSMLKNATDPKLRNMTQGLYSRCIANFTGMIAFGLTQEALENFRAAISQFDQSIAKPRLEMSKTRQHSHMLFEALKKSDEALKQIDILTETLKLSDPNFYLGYRSVRKLITASSSALIIKVFTKEALTGEPLQGVTVTLTLEMSENEILSGMKPTIYKKRTAPKGRTLPKVRSEGVYIVEVHKHGYQKEMKRIAITQGDSCELIFEMKRI